MANNKENNLENLKASPIKLELTAALIRRVLIIIAKNNIYLKIRCFPLIVT